MNEEYKNKQNKKEVEQNKKTCCGKTFTDSRMGRSRHRKQMAELGFECPLEKKRDGPK